MTRIKVSVKAVTLNAFQYRHFLATKAFSFSEYSLDVTRGDEFFYPQVEVKIGGKFAAV